MPHSRCVQVGVCTASQENHRNTTMVAFIVESNYLFVLAPKDHVSPAFMSEAFVLGVLYHNDVAVVAATEANWLMIERGSWVRHPLNHKVRIQLEVNAWILTETSEGEVLLSPYNRNSVETHFLMNEFAELPLANDTAPPEAIWYRDGSAQKVRDFNDDHPRTKLEQEDLQVVTSPCVRIRMESSSEELAPKYAPVALGHSIVVQLVGFDEACNLNGLHGVCEHANCELDDFVRDGESTAAEERANANATWRIKSYAIRLDSGERIDVDPKHLRVMEKSLLEVSVPVRVVDFDLMPMLNGMEGCCKRWFEQMGCWQVRLSETLDHILIEPEHLTVLIPDPACVHPALQHPDFWHEIGRAHASHPELDEKHRKLVALANSYEGKEGFADKLKKLRARQKLTDLRHEIENPVYKRFGLPEGQECSEMMGYELARMAKIYPHSVSAVADNMIANGYAHMTTPEKIIKAQDKEIQHREAVRRFKEAPQSLLIRLAASLGITSEVVPEMLASQLPYLKEHAKSLADRQIEHGQVQFLASTVQFGDSAFRVTEYRSKDPEFRKTLYESAEAYLRSLFDRVMRPVRGFTTPATDWPSSWAKTLIQKRHVLALQTRPVNNRCMSGVGFTVINGAIDAELACRAHLELSKMSEQGKLTTSNNLCNWGVRFVFLQFGKEQDQCELPPALRDLCLKLAGIPDAIEEAFRVHGFSSDRMTMPRLRFVPEVMAATYSEGTEYHIHRDSDGTNNARVLTILLYLNAEWAPGDGGELRIHASEGQDGPAMPDKFVDIAPICGRIVIFRARDIWHAVREPCSARWALTLWVFADE